MSCPLSTSLIPLPEAEEGRHTNPLSYTIKTLHLPNLICPLNYLSVKCSFTISSHCHQARFLGGPVLCVPPTVYYPITMLHIHFPP
jgi:hypothetical protein